MEDEQQRPWQRAMEALRDRVGSYREMGEALGVAPMTAWRWHAGITEPWPGSLLRQAIERTLREQFGIEIGEH